ncbi:hypothetical protein [Streptomyces sp. CO7]
MPATADQLLSALEPLPFPDRLRLTATTARDLARQGDGALARLLAELDARGPYERRLAALAALAGRDVPFLAARLADADQVVARQAHRGARTLPVPDEAIEAAYQDAPDVLRHHLAALIVAGGRTALAERLLPRLREEWGDHEAARLLRACSAPFVARHLPSLAHAVDGWPGLARRHPDAVLDHLVAERERARRDARRGRWWTDHGPTVTALAAARPERVLELLERGGPATVPAALHPAFPALVAADAERFTRWLLAPEREPERWEPALPQGLLRKLVRVRPPSLPALARRWLWRPAHLPALFRALPPSARAELLDAAADVGSGFQPADDLLRLLPRERRHAEVRLQIAAFEPDDYWWDRLDTLAHGPYREAREELLAGIRRRDADDREAAWRPLVTGATLDGDPGAVAELLTVMGERLRNDRDPVRRSALETLAQVRPTVFTAAHAPLLERVATDALEARDASPATRAAVARLATQVLAAHLTGDGDALRSWALTTLERLVGRSGVPQLGPLHRRLRRGQENEVLRTLSPWLDRAAERAEFRLLLSLAEAFGPRARRMPDLQDRLAVALERGDDETFRAAVGFWLADPRTRDERVARLLESEPSAAVLPPVLRVLSRRNTDLLDVLLADLPPHGRFLPRDARRPLPDLAVGGRWLPRQQVAAARLAEQQAADPGLPLDERAAVIRAVAPLPGLGARPALRHVDDREVVVAEAALAALPWTDRPQEALPLLLDHAATDRARVAVYAAARAARFARPSELAPALGAMLTGERPAKVTSRKEAARLAAAFLPPRRAVELLARAFEAEDCHQDVRAAIVPLLPALAGEARAWDLLEPAARDERLGVRDVLFALRPPEFAREYRLPFARLLGEAYEAVLTTPGALVPGPASGALAAWSGEDARLSGLLARTVGDFRADLRSDSFLRPWSTAADAVRNLAVSALPHPVGGAAEGSVLHTTVTALLASLHTPEGSREATREADLPALRRLRVLLADSSFLPWRPDIAAGLAGLIAHEPLLAHEHAQLLAARVDPAAGADETVAALGEVARSLEGAGVTTARSVAQGLGQRLTRHSAGPDVGGAATTAEAAGRLAADGGTVTGLLAMGLTAGFGPRYDWPDEWRELLLVLRRHPDPDVRYLAHEATTARR